MRYLFQARDVLACYLTMLIVSVGALTSQAPGKPGSMKPRWPDKPPSAKQAERWRREIEILKAARPALKKVKDAISLDCYIEIGRAITAKELLRAGKRSPADMAAIELCPDFQRLAKLLAHCAKWSTPADGEKMRQLAAYYRRTLRRDLSAGTRAQRAALIRRAAVLSRAADVIAGLRQSKGVAKQVETLHRAMHVEKLRAADRFDSEAQAVLSAGPSDKAVAAALDQAAMRFRVLIAEGVVSSMFDDLRVEAAWAQQKAYALEFERLSAFYRKRS